MGKLSKSKFRDLCNEVGLLASEHQKDTLYLLIQGVLEEGKAKNAGQAAVAAYCSAFERTHGSKCRPSGQEARQLKQLAEGEGIERACALIDVYFALPQYTPHPVGQLLYHLNAIRIAHDTGRQVTRQEARQAERRVATANAFGKLLTKRGGDEQ